MNEIGILLLCDVRREGLVGLSEIRSGRRDDSSVSCGSGLYRKCSVFHYPLSGRPPEWIVGFWLQPRTVRSIVWLKQYSGISFDRKLRICHQFRKYERPLVRTCETEPRDGDETFRASLMFRRLGSSCPWAPWPSSSNNDFMRFLSL